jgi:hypothetical protein
MRLPEHGIYYLMINKMNLFILKIKIHEPAVKLASVGPF